MLYIYRSVILTVPLYEFILHRSCGVSLSRVLLKESIKEKMTDNLFSFDLFFLYFTVFCFCWCSSFFALFCRLVGFFLTFVLFEVMHIGDIWSLK